jgi:hypothetical protein
MYNVEFQVKRVDVRQSLNKSDLPSITGLAARGPRFPNPSTAVRCTPTA